jgi:hypothetical protein
MGIVPTRGAAVVISDRMACSSHPTKPARKTWEHAGWVFGLAGEMDDGLWLQDHMPEDTVGDRRYLWLVAEALASRQKDRHDNQSSVLAVHPVHGAFVCHGQAFFPARPGDLAAVGFISQALVGWHLLAQATEAQDLLAVGRAVASAVPLAVGMGWDIWRNDGSGWTHEEEER